MSGKTPDRPAQASKPATPMKAASKAVTSVLLPLYGTSAAGARAAETSLGPMPSA